MAQLMACNVCLAWFCFDSARLSPLHQKPQGSGLSSRAGRPRNKQCLSWELWEYGSLFS